MRSFCAEGWASCPLTENACLRVLTNPRYARPVTPGIVLARLGATKSAGNHTFWADDLSITEKAVFDWNRLQGHQQVTDVYLLALALHAADGWSRSTAASGVKPCGDAARAIS